MKGSLYASLTYMENENAEFSELHKEIEKSMGSWSNIFKGEGALCIVVSIIGLAMSINSFTLSKKEDYYHLSNQWMNFV